MPLNVYYLRQIPALRLAALLLMIAMPASYVQAQVKALGQVTGTNNFEFPGWFKQSFLEIKDDASEAGETNKHVLLFFHLDNCPYCAQTLAENFNTGANSNFIKTNFDSIDINVKGDREVVFNEKTSVSEKKLAEHLGVLYTPTIVFINADNKQVFRIDGYRNATRFRVALEYVKEKAYLSSDFASFSATRLRDAGYKFLSHSAFKQLTDFQTAAKKPLAIIIEDKQCEDCVDVHKKLFARADVSSAFSQLTVVRVDAQSEQQIIDPTGRKISMRDWIKELGISYRPGVLLYDQGKEIARIDNRLYSWHFNGFVTWVAGRHYQTQADVYAYMAELREAMLNLGKNVSYTD